MMPKVKNFGNVITIHRKKQIDNYLEFISLIGKILLCLYRETDTHIL